VAKQHHNQLPGKQGIKNHSRVFLVYSNVETKAILHQRTIQILNDYLFFLLEKSHRQNHHTKKTQITFIITEQLLCKMSLFLLHKVR